MLLPPARDPQDSQRGFALLIVLWSLVLISFLVATLTKAAHDGVAIATNVRLQAEQQSIADGAIFEAAFHLRDGNQHWLADDQIHRYTRGRNLVSVAMVDEAGKINLNTASSDLLRGLLLTEGVDAARATSLANAIVDWRESDDDASGGGLKSDQYRAAGKNYGPPGSFFKQMDEINLLLGMNPALSARLIPHLTLFSTYGPTSDTKDATIAALLHETQQAAVGLTDDDYHPVDVVSVSAIVESPNGHKATRSSVIKFDHDAHGITIKIMSSDRS